MDAEKIQVGHAPNRCPYCHEDVKHESEPWLACAACLARHAAKGSPGLATDVLIFATFVAALVLMGVPDLRVFGIGLLVFGAIGAYFRFGRSQG